MHLTVKTQLSPVNVNDWSSFDIILENICVEMGASLLYDHAKPFKTSTGEMLFKECMLMNPVFFSLLSLEVETYRLTAAVDLNAL